MREYDHIILEKWKQQLSNTLAAIWHSVFSKINRECNEIPLVLLEILVSTSNARLQPSSS